MQSPGETPKFLNLRLRAVDLFWKPILWIFCSLLSFSLAIVTSYSSLCKASFVLIAVVDTFTIVEQISMDIYPQ